MLVYRFSIRNGRHREDLGVMSLLNDCAAAAFGNAVIRDMLPENPERQIGCTMEVRQGERAVCRIAFPKECEAA